MKMSTFEHGSIAILKNEAKVFIPSGGIGAEDLNILKENQKKEPLSLDIKHIEETNGRIVIAYDIPKHFMSLQSIQKESLPVRLSFLRSILEDDPLQNRKNVSIHPATLFFRPMSTIRYTYMAYSRTPTDQEFSSFLQYKALVLAILTNQSYEAFLKNEEAAYQPKKLRFSENEKLEIERIIASIKDSSTTEELKKDIRESTEFAQFKYFGDMEKVKHQYKKQIFSIAIIALIFFSGGAWVFHLLSDNKQREVLAAYDTTLKERDLEIQTLAYLSSGDYMSAAKNMARQGKSKEDIATVLIKGKEYQAAIEQHPDTLEKVIEELYRNGEEDKILELALKDNRMLDLEQAIVANDTNRMISEISFLENSGTATRMGRKFLSSGDLNRARQISETYKLEALGKEIDLNEKENQIIFLQGEMDRVKHNKDLSKEDKAKQLKNIEGRIEEAKQDIIALKDELGKEENNDEA